MKHQNKMIFGTVILGGAVGIGAQFVGFDGLARPLLWLGGVLRQCALSGMWGNLFVWVLALGVSVLPVGHILWLQGRHVWQCRRMAKGLQHTQPTMETPAKTADGIASQSGVTSSDGFAKIGNSLRILLSLQLFALFFYLINPTLTPQWTVLSASGGMSASGVYLVLLAWSVVASACFCLLLCGVRAMQSLSVAKSAHYLPRLLRVGGVVFLFLATCGAAQTYLVTLEQLHAENTWVSWSTLRVLAIVSGLRLVPNLLGGVALFWVGDIAQALLDAPYADTTIALCGRMAQRCLWVVVSACVLCVACNLLQLLYFAQLLSVSVELNLPLFPLLLAGALFLLCHYVSDASAIAQDNDSII